MRDTLPARFCEICGVIHHPPIHDVATCSPCNPGSRLYFTPLPDLDDPLAWPTKDEMRAAIDYWDVVLADKGTKPLS
jgi:hypothetical protein